MEKLEADFIYEEACKQKRYQRETVKSGMFNDVVLINWLEKQYAVIMPHPPTISFIVPHTTRNPLAQYPMIREHLLAGKDALFDMPLLHAVADELDTKTHRPQYVIFDAVDDAHTPQTTTASLADATFDLLQRGARFPTTKLETVPGCDFQNNIAFAQHFCQTAQAYYENLQQNPSAQLIFSQLGLMPTYFDELSQTFTEQMTPGPVSLIHPDLHLGNILYKKGDMQRKPVFIDWDDVCIGDPLYALVLFEIISKRQITNDPSSQAQYVETLFQHAANLHDISADQVTKARELYAYLMNARRVCSFVEFCLDGKDDLINLSPSAVSRINQARSFRNSSAPLNRQQISGIFTEAQKNVPRKPTKPRHRRLLPDSFTPTPSFLEPAVSIAEISEPNR